MSDEMSAKNLSSWLVVNTQPHRERYACENLVRQEFNVYCPMGMRRIRHARRSYDAPRPMFPGYVFVELPVRGVSWRPILSTYGVRSIVWNGEQPGTINSELIESLKYREVDGVVRKPQNPFRVGQKVAVQSGPFDGLVGEIVEMREKDRLLVLLNMVHQGVKTNMHSDQLRRL